MTFSSGTYRLYINLLKAQGPWGGWPASCTRPRTGGRPGGCRAGSRGWWWGRAAPVSSWSAGGPAAGHTAAIWSRQNVYFCISFDRKGYSFVVFKGVTEVTRSRGIQFPSLTPRITFCFRLWQNNRWNSYFLNTLLDFILSTTSWLSF